MRTILCMFMVVPLLAALGKNLDTRSARMHKRIGTFLGRSGRRSLSPITADTLAKVRVNDIAISKNSSELGTLAEALLEYSWPQLSVFDFDDGAIPPSNFYRNVNPVDIVNISTFVVKNRVNDSDALAIDPTVGGPASIGPAVLLTNWTLNNPSDTQFSTAATAELRYILNETQRTTDGAISSAEDEVQLWSDFVFMGPPFIAYYGAYQQGSTQTQLLQAAYDQCRLYRQYLQDPENLLWKHIELGSQQDNNFWATGNALAAAGMFRVLRAIRLSSSSSNFLQQQTDLANWIKEIVTSSWNQQTTDGALHNYINDSNTFEDASSTALMAAVTFRLAIVMQDFKTNIDNAEAAYTYVSSKIDSDGWLRQTVDPATTNSLSSSGTPSSAGQSFVLMMESARRSFQEMAGG